MLTWHYYHFCGIIHGGNQTVTFFQNDIDHIIYMYIQHAALAVFISFLFPLYICVYGEGLKIAYLRKYFYWSEVEFDTRGTPKH